MAFVRYGPLRISVLMLLALIAAAVVFQTDFAQHADRTGNRRSGQSLTPYLLNVKPPSARVGERVKIEGGNFLGGPVTVTFNGVPAMIKDVKEDELRVYVPVGALSGPLQVAVGGRVSNAVHFDVRIAAGAPVDAASQPPADSVGLPRPDSTGTVSFSKQIQPIFDARCTTCHGGSGGLVLDEGESYSNLANVTAQKSCPSEKRVTPGNASASVLYKKISGTSCGTQMPKKGPPLSEAEIRLIRTWIDEGARNN
jgi:hypothetical protein